MEKVEAKLAERGAEAAPPRLVRDVMEFPAVRIVPTHTLMAVWRYFREFPHDMFPVFRNAFVDVVDGAIYPQSILLLRDRSDDRKVRDVVNNAVFVQADATVEDLYRLLKERRVPGAVVVDRDGKYLGIATLRGLLEAVRRMKPKAKSVAAVYSEFGKSVALAGEGDPVERQGKREEARGRRGGGRRGGQRRRRGFGRVDGVGFREVVHMAEAQKGAPPHLRQRGQPGVF